MTIKPEQDGNEVPQDFVLAGPLADIQAVIASAKARGGVESMERHLHKTLRGSSDVQVREAAELAVEIVDSIPIFLARAHQEAQRRGLASVVGPLLDQAERYFLQPLDLIPEMTQGLPGLLDDAYLVIRVLQNLEKGPEPFLDWDLEFPAKFLRTSVGAVVAERLDSIAADAMQEVSTHLTELWSRMAHDA